MDMLLIGVPHFRVPTRRRIDYREHRHTSTKTYRQHELLRSSFVQVLSLASAAKRCLQSGNHDFLGPPWFVAAGVLTAEMMM